MHEYGETCSKPEECYDHVGLTCINNICNCTQNFYYQETLCGKNNLKIYIFLILNNSINRY